MNVANALTWSRLLFVPFLYYAGLTDNRLLFGILFLIGGLTDALDGYFARLSGVTKYGQRLDSIADVFFFSSGLLIFQFISLNAVQWFIITALVAMWSFGIVYGMLIKKLLFPHNIYSKFATFGVFLFVTYSSFIGFSSVLFYVVSVYALFAVFRHIQFCIKE